MHQLPFIYCTTQPTGGLCSCLYCRQPVDAAAVVHLLHHVVHVVVGDLVIGRGRGGGIARLVVVEAPIGVVVTAAGVVRAPPVPDRDAGIRHVVDLVVGDRGVGDVGGQERDAVAVVHADVVHEVVADGDVPVGHPGVARMVGVGLHAAGEDRAGRDPGEDRTGHGDAAGAEAHAARVGVGVVADADRYLAEVDELVAGEGDRAGCGHLHRGGHLAPARPGGLELRAAGAAGAV